MRQLHLQKLTLYEAIIPNTIFNSGPDVIQGFGIFESDENGSLDKIFLNKTVTIYNLNQYFMKNKTASKIGVDPKLWKNKCL